MIFCRSTALALGCALLLGTSFAAEAMTLVVNKGEVRVSRGAGFRPVSGTINVEPGYTVIVDAGGQAELICSDGGRLDLIQPGYYPVPVDCAAGQSWLESMNTAFEPLGAAGPLLVGGAVLGGTIAIIRNSDSDDKPASK